MDEPARWVHDLRRRTEVTVDPAWQARIVDGVERRGRRRAIVVPTLAVAAASALLVSGALLLRQEAGQRPVAQAPRPAPPAGTLRFDEGATGVAAAPGSETAVAERTPERTRVELRRGAIRFEVSRLGREFRVEAGPVRVIVLGTAFTVERGEARIGVSVARGRVRVEAPAETVELAAGESRWFALEAAPPAAEPPAAAAETPLAEPEARPAQAARPAVRWQALARQGQYAQAYKLLKQRGEGPRDDVEELLLAADAARHSDHWIDAIGYYDRVTARYARDPRAGLAAFTKGRILLHQLGRPAEAARAFAAARALALPDGLAHDALVREVEALDRSGDAARARARAAEYLRRYPDGPARAAMTMRETAGQTK